MAKTQDYYDFLEDLRLSGCTNMFGASPYLVKEFGISEKKAKEILIEWMKSCEREESC
jgi:hypothetical protein